MFGFCDSFEHGLDLGDRGIVRNERLVSFETDLSTGDAFDGKQCGPHRLNAAFSRHALDGQRDRRRLVAGLRIDGGDGGNETREGYREYCEHDA